MPDTTKHIANLDVKTSDATRQLTELSAAINELSRDAEGKFKNIGNAAEKAFKNIKTSSQNSVDISKLIDVEKFNKALQKMESYNQTTMNKLAQEGAKMTVKHQDQLDKRLTVEKTKKEKTAYENQKTANKLLVMEQKKQNELTSIAENGFSTRLAKYTIPIKHYSPIF